MFLGRVTALVPEHDHFISIWSVIHKKMKLHSVSVHKHFKDGNFIERKAVLVPE